LKGASANLGAKRACAAATDLELLARAGNLGKAQEQWEIVKQETRRLLQEFDVILRKAAH
jgi:HPt (histidine-containing phosphotransfer) domain-containing protein